MNFGKGLERVKILRAALAEGAGEPGEVLDENAKIACGSGALTILEAQRPAAPRSPAPNFCAARI